MIDGHFSVDQVTETAIRRPDILEMTRRIEVVEDPELEALGDRYAIKLEFFLRDGSCLQEKLLQAKGSEEWPLTEAEIVSKFKLLASKTLKPSQVERLLETVQGLERAEDARILSRLATPIN